jgi:hypothetical protein
MFSLSTPAAPLKTIGECEVACPTKTPVFVAIRGSHARWDSLERTAPHLTAYAEGALYY